MDVITTTQIRWKSLLGLCHQNLSLSSEEGVAQGLLHRAVIGLPLDEPIVAAKKYYELTADQVNAAFRKHIDPNGVSIVKAGDFKAAGVYK